MINRTLIILAALLVSANAYASVRGFTAAGANLGAFNDVQCGTNLTCAKTSGKLKVTLTQNPLGLGDTIVTTAATLTVSQCGSTIYSSAAGTYVLPSISNETALGCRLTFVVGGTHQLYVDPSTDQEQILLMTNAGGDRISADAQGESVTLVAVSSGLLPKWAPVGKEQGTWTDSN